MEGKSFTVEIIDSVKDYLELMKEIFDFGALKKLLQGGFKVLIDSMNGGKIGLLILTVTLCVFSVSD